MSQIRLSVRYTDGLHEDYSWKDPEEASAGLLGLFKSIDLSEVVCIRIESGLSPRCIGVKCPNN